MEQSEPIKQELYNNLDETLFKSEDDWLSVKKKDNYFYAERKGVDSIAFVLFDINLNDLKRIGVIKQYIPPFGKFMTTAFTGSIDKDYYKDDLRVLVQEEVLEESGFNVELQDIKFYGKFLVSTQINQFCYLFGVTVNKNLQGERTTTNPTELQAELVWLELPEVIQLEDWKTILVVTKRMAAANSKITIRPLNS